MEALNLKLIELDIELRYEVLKNVVTFVHQFSGLLVSEYLLNVDIGALKVREKQNEDFLGVSRDFNKVNGVINLMEVAIKNLSGAINAILIEAYVHGWRSFLRYNVQFGLLSAVLRVKVSIVVDVGILSRRILAIYRVLS